ncbi:glycoside hydrolase family 125 protein [Parabacteroides sp. PF5-6]|uniref:glycoside hydrolase family 125 protein n=1 Tax=Parabacteroides sp. PF5-6 TaxID=1742403 RepID=UPI002404BECB|nr:glycoside hydrolase family 125 protein [Parabacteroides sp. PF5-6]MDF9831162.1 meiotically up-regulated gene 157 (Mug157) protein [Parabacteroides sp. PF5-6]
MTTRRNFLKSGSLALAGLMVGQRSIASMAEKAAYTTPGTAATMQYVCKRPALADRQFTSEAVEKAIQTTKAKLKDPKLAWMFENCFPNTLDTTCEHSMKNGKPDTFVITGDIHAMWLRDSSAQVFPHVQFANADEKVRVMLEGVIRRQTKCILIDPYANAFNDGPLGGEWQKDRTKMKLELHERKWEIDSLCYPIRLAYHYWKKTGNTAPFDANWVKAIELIYQTFIEQQRKDNLGPYSFQRVTDRQGDTVLNDGWGSPVKPVGLIVSTFRPSDDASLFGFLIPSNLFAITSLRQVAEMLREIKNNTSLASKCEALAKEVEDAVKKYAIVEHPVFGKVYAFEVDGFHNVSFMDDANVPSLLALPYLGCVDQNDPIYQNTRKLVLSEYNPYFFKGTAGEGIGGPHIGYDMVWPMSIIMRCNTTNDNEEIRHCVRMLRDTDANTGFMHESFHKNNPEKFTRSWFAWVNTLFGEMIYRLVNEGKTDILNNLG